jgi:hypothetical protein
MVEWQQAMWYTDNGTSRDQEDGMIEYVRSLLHSPTVRDGVLLGLGISIVALFSILAGRAQARMWRAINRHNGERRELQRQITMGKSHLR